MDRHRLAYEIRRKGKEFLRVPVSIFGVAVEVPSLLQIVFFDYATIGGVIEEALEMEDEYRWKRFNLATRELTKVGPELLTKLDSPCDGCEC